METYNLRIMTPEREFFNGEVISLTVRSIDGELCILAHHLPMIAALEVGEIALRIADPETGEETVRRAFASGGFVEVLTDRVMCFTQACEWPEEIDVRRAEESRIRAEERLRQKQSVVEYKSSKIALARAMARLRISGHGIK